MKLIVTLFLACTAMWAQDNSNAAHTSGDRSGTGAPSSCVKVGEAYKRMDAAAGQKILICTATGTPGTWEAQGGSGSSILTIGGSMGAGLALTTGQTMAYMVFGSNVATVSAAYWTAPWTASFTKFYITPRTNGYTSSTTVTCDFFVNDVEKTTGPTIVIASSTAVPGNNLSPFSFSDTAHTLSLTAGDNVRMQCVNGSGASSHVFNSWTLSQ